MFPRSMILAIVRALPCVMIGLVAQGVGAQAGEVGNIPRDSWSRAVVRDVGRAQAATSPLDRLVTLDLRNVPLKDALQAIAKASGATVIYGDVSVPIRRTVSFTGKDITVARVLAAVLRGTGHTYQLTPAGIVIRREAAEPASGEAASAQGTIHGTVKDASTGVAVVGAAIIVDAGRFGAVSNDAGEYEISAVPAGQHTVTARRIAYAPSTQSVVVPEGGTVAIDFVLRPTASRLREIVTTASGDQQRVELGHVIGQINADSVIGQAPITSFSDLVSGRVAGVQVDLNGGYVGTSPRIRIRGVNSPTVSNAPLLVIDGVRVDNSVGSPSSTTFGGTSGRLDDLNPEEIASIEIVKGPSAATLYGTDAANGVILVTTKRGTPGRAIWNMNAEGGTITQPATFPDNYYSWGHNGAGTVQQCVLPSVASNLCTVDSLTRTNPLSSAATSPLGTGVRQQYGAQVSGGTAQLRYFLAGNYEDESGFLKLPASEIQRLELQRGTTSIPKEQRNPNTIKRVAVRANLSTNVAQNADIEMSLGLNSIEDRLPNNNVFVSGLFGSGNPDNTDGWASFLGRPGEAFGVRNSEDITHATGGLGGHWRPWSWLETRATFGLDYSGTFIDDLQRYGEGPLGSGRSGLRRNTRMANSQYTTDLGASALFAVAPRVISRTSVGMQYNKRVFGATVATGRNLVPGAETVTSAAIQTTSEQNIESIVAGGYIEQTFGLDQRLYVTGALRADGGSSFGRDFHTALYPKGSLSWLVADQRTGILNSLRLRVAYGASGVQPGSTDALTLVTYGPVVMNGGTVTGARDSTLGNPKLKPERQAELETGFDAELAASRVRLELTYYNRRSSDALVNQPLPPDLGVGFREENIGSVRNRGVEGALSVTLADGSAATWDVSLNGSVNHNELERLGQDVVTIGTNPLAQNRVGRPLFSRFDRPILGYQDANGNGIIEPSEVTVGDTAVYLGPSSPTRQLTLGSTLALLGGKVRIATQFDYRGGQTVFNSNESSRCLLANCRALNDPSASLSDQARAVALTRYGTQAGYIQNGSFVRWREFSVTYTLPNAAARAIRAHGAGLTLTGRNLHLFKRYVGVDPEANGLTQFFPEGYLDGQTAPPARYWIVRLNLGF